MDLNKIPLMSAIIRKMDWLTEKQSVITQNVANADTPGYRAISLSEPDFRQFLERAPANRPYNPSVPRATHRDHITVASAANVTPVRSERAEASDISPNGNNVVLEEQMMEMTATQMEFGLLVNLYKKHASIIRASLGRNR